MRDRREESASYLYEPHNAQAIMILSANMQPHQCAGVPDAIAFAKARPEGVSHEVEVKFQNGRVLREIFEEKHILVQFLEAFL